MDGRRSSRRGPTRRLRFRDRQLTLGRLFYFVLDKGAILIFPLALYILHEMQMRR